MEQLIVTIYISIQASVFIRCAFVNSLKAENDRNRKRTG